MKKTLLLLFLTLTLTMPVLAQVKPTVAIFGDSYSTFDGFIPKENAIWYYAKKQKSTDVTSVEQTWWWQVIKEGGYKLGVNDAWSGSTICNTGYNDDDYTNESFVTRSAILGRLGNPDIILICGGTNDNWANVQMGEYKYKDWKRGDLYYFRPAMAKMFDNLQKHYPNVELYFILNSELKDSVNKSVETICKHYNVKLIKLHDIDKMNGHPTIKGMKSFAEQVLAAIK